MARVELHAHNASMGSTADARLFLAEFAATQALPQDWRPRDLDSLQLATLLSRWDARHPCTDPAARFVRLLADDAAWSDSQALATWLEDHG
jgi:hypothetical protein